MTLTFVFSIIFLNIDHSFIACSLVKKQKCDNCITADNNDKYYDALSNLFNSISVSKSNSLHKSLPKRNFSSQCASVRLGRSDSLSKKSNYSDKYSDLIFNIIGQITLPLCPLNVSSQNSVSLSNTSWTLWIAGFISVTVINACAALGFVFKPLMKQKSYKIVMAFMIAMAVGSLSGSALLILIPDSFKLTELQHSATIDYVDYKYKATVVFGGVYMFFLVERFLKWIINRQCQGAIKEREHHHGSMNICRPQRHELTIHNEPIVELEQVCLVDEPLKNGIINNDKNGSVHCLSATLTVLGEKKKLIARIAPVAWMIICGDALHNFIDGLSMGAAFSLSIFKGISLSLAVLCEELPHELGDFAILINAGMTVKQALLWNLLSAATCYLGFIVGVLLGEMTTSSTWVFAIAGGMFLYISLVDMMPELNAILEDSKTVPFGRLKIFIIQNIGLWFGYGIILIMSLYGDRISIQST